MMKLKHASLSALLGLALMSQASTAQDAFAYFRGETFPAARPTPAAWLLELHKADDFLNATISVAEFLPNTRLAWHNHPGGQVLLITDGVGYYQEKGKPKQIVRVGDVVKCAPGVEHWHGSAVESRVTYIAISPAQKGPTVWADPVSDDDYNARAVDRRNAPASKLLAADDVFPFSIAKSTFAPGKKADWSPRATGQILIVTDGSGRYEERGKAQQVLRKGDVVMSAKGVEQSHGASSEASATFIVITPAGATK